MCASAQAPFIVLLGGGALFLVVAVGIELFVRTVLGGSAEVARVVGFGSSAVFLALLSVVAYRLFLRFRRHRPVPLDAAWLLRSEYREAIGEKAAGLCHLALLGFPVAAGWVVLPSTFGRLRRAAATMRSRLRELGVGRAIVRSSFPEEDRGHLFPGVFESVGDVPLAEDGALLDALQRVARSYDHDRVARYRAALTLTADERRDGAMVVQEHLDCERVGVVSSFHPASRRLDHVTIEMDGEIDGEIDGEMDGEIDGEMDGEGDGVDVWCPLSRVWTRRGTSLDLAARTLLLDALEAGETFYGGPVVIEFGVVDGAPFVFQVRRAPDVPLAPVWTSGGPLGVNPELLPPLHHDIVFGADHEVLVEAVLASLDDPAEVETGTDFVHVRHGRPMVDYTALAPAVRFRRRVFVFPWGLVPLARRHRRAVARARRLLAGPCGAGAPDVASIRALCLAQSEVQHLAERWRGVADQLEDDARGRGRRKGRTAGRLRRRSARLGALRDELHARIVADLERYTAAVPVSEPVAAAGGAAFLRLGEVEGPDGAAAADPATIAPAAVAARCDRYRANDGRPAPFVHSPAPTLAQLYPDDGATPAWDAPDGVPLVALVEGSAEGEVVVAGPGAATKDRIVLLPDTSLRWMEAVLDARAVLMVGRGLLAHLSLLLLEVQTPTLVGLPAEWAGQLAGQTVRIEDGRLHVTTAATATSQ